MIQQQTILKVLDNSGVKHVKCLKILGGFKKKIAKVGDIIIVSILSFRENPKKPSKIKKGWICKALVIRTKKPLIKKNSSTHTLYDNCVVLMNRTSEPLATRIIGPVPLSLKKKHVKFASISIGFF
jgi:large subunit ribosomal protein L14